MLVGFGLTTMKSHCIIIFVILLFVHQACCNVVVTESQKTIYDKFPKLRINGQGFTGTAQQTHLTFTPALEQNKDFIIEVQSENTLIVKLLANKKWIKGGASSGTLLALRFSFIASLIQLKSLLFLHSSLVIDSVSTENQLDRMMIVGNVIESPTIVSNSKVRFSLSCFTFFLS